MTSKVQRKSSLDGEKTEVLKHFPPTSSAPYVMPFIF